MGWEVGLKEHSFIVFCGLDQTWHRNKNSCLFLFVNANAWWTHGLAFHGIERFSTYRIFAILNFFYFLKGVREINSVSTFWEVGNIIDESWNRYKRKNNYPADEAIRMPLRVQRRNIILHYSAITAVALGRKHIKVIVAAIWLAVTLMEAVLAELLATLGTEEMLRMPRLL